MQKAKEKLCSFPSKNQKTGAAKEEDDDKAALRRNRL
jgi:hypothetical protein